MLIMNIEGELRRVQLSRPLCRIERIAIAWHSLSRLGGSSHCLVPHQEPGGSSVMACWPGLGLPFRGAPSLPVTSGSQLDNQFYQLLSVVASNHPANFHDLIQSRQDHPPAITPSR